jgi:hypothetical protein
LIRPGNLYQGKIENPNRFAYTVQPSRRKNTVKRRYPYRTDVAANSFNRRRKGIWGSFRLRHRWLDLTIFISLVGRRSLIR